MLSASGEVAGETLGIKASDGDTWFGCVSGLVHLGLES